MPSVRPCPNIRVSLESTGSEPVAWFSAGAAVMMETAKEPVALMPAASRSA
jgi:hypothetical protein